MAINEEGAQDPRAGWFPTLGLELLIRCFWGLEAPGFIHLPRLSLPVYIARLDIPFLLPCLYISKTPSFRRDGTVQTTLCSSKPMYLVTGNFQHKSTVFVIHNLIKLESGGNTRLKASCTMLSWRATKARIDSQG